MKKMKDFQMLKKKEAQKKAVEKSMPCELSLSFLIHASQDLS